MRHGSETHDIALFYPQQSLLDQISEAAAEGNYALTVSLARNASALRDIMRNADAAVIDATPDPARAAAALTSLLKLVPPRRLAVYTELLHAGLEIFVRSRGPFLLMGPMSRRLWNDYLAYATTESADAPETLTAPPVAKRRHA